MAQQSYPDFVKLDRSYKVNEKCQAIKVAFSSDRSQLAIAFGSMGKHDFSNKVLIWNLPKWKKVASFRGCTETVDDLTFSVDGDSLICAGSTKNRFMGGEITVWDTATWQTTRTIEGADVESIRSVASSADGKFLVTGSACHNSSGTEKKLRLWDAHTGRQLKHFAEFGPDISSLQFSPDGNFLAVGLASDRTASIWRIPSAKKVWLKRVHAQASRLRLLFSPDGSLLASCGDNKIAVSNAASGKSVVVLKGHENSVGSVAFSPDGSNLISAAYQEVCLWEIPSGQLLGKQALPETYLTGLCFTHDASVIGVHSINDELRIDQYTIQNLSTTNSSTSSVASKPAAKPFPRSDREQELVAAVVADPDNDAPRLQYAKWLDEQNDPRGEFIRIQCESAPLDALLIPTTAEKRQRTRLNQQARKLIEQHFADWTIPLADLKLLPGQVEFRRGFVWRLNLRDIEITDVSLKLLSRIPELECLDLDGSGVTDKGMRHLNKVPNLSEIRISETAVTVKSLTHLTDLKRLTLVHNYKWGNEPVPEIESFKQFRNRRFLDLPKSKQRAEAIRALGIIVDWMRPDENGKYTTVSYSQSWATNSDLVYLQAIPEVENLSFFECGAVTSEGLDHLRPLKNLRSLHLNESGVTDLAPLRHLPSLEELNVDSLEQLDPASFRHLRSLPNLKILEARFCRLGDEILEPISDCKELQTLDLIYNKFTTDGLQQLLKLKKLQKIEIDYMDDHRDLVTELIGKPAPRRRRN